MLDLSPRAGFIRIQWTKMNRMTTHIAHTHHTHTLARIQIVQCWSHTNLRFPISFHTVRDMYLCSFYTILNKSGSFIRLKNELFFFARFSLDALCLNDNKVTDILRFSVFFCSGHLMCGTANEPYVLNDSVHFSFSFPRIRLMCAQSTLTVL